MSWKAFWKWTAIVLTILILLPLVVAAAVVASCLALVWAVTPGLTRAGLNIMVQPVLLPLTMMGAGYHEARIRK